MARAVYCKCRNTYSIECDKAGKKCNADEYWKQGIGSIHNDNHQSTIVNIDTTRIINN